MKQVLLLFVLAFFYQSAMCQYSDLKEYGLKGKIKVITQAVYSDLNGIGGKMPISETDKPVFRKTLHFNRSGQIDTMMYFDYFDSVDSTKNNSIVFDFKKGIKSGGKNVDYKNQLVSEFEIKWINNRIYKFVSVIPESGKRYEITSWLDFGFRDSAGQTLVYDNGKLIDNEVYSNLLDESGRLVQVDYFYELTKSKSSEIIEYLEFDNEGNWTKSVVRDKDTGKFKKMSIRTITYY